MAAATTYAPEYYDDLQSGRPGVVLHRTVKRDISDSAGSNNHLAESGDKYYVFKIPKYARLFNLDFGQKGLDTNAVPTLSLKVIVDDGTTQFELVTDDIVPASGAWELRKADVEHIGDMLDVEDCDVYIESTAAAATAGTSGCEIYAHAKYAIERAGVDPA